MPLLPHDLTENIAACPDKEREVKKGFEAAVAMLQHFDAEKGNVKEFLARISLLSAHTNGTTRMQQ
jgi:hypothetical protein